MRAMLLPMPAPGRASPAAASAPLRLRVAPEGMLLALCAFWVLACNRPLWTRVLDGAHAWWEPAVWAVGLIALHALLLAPLLTRHTARPLLALLIIGTAVASFYMEHLGVVLDPSMLRNLLRTDWHEARELLSTSMLPHLGLMAGLPLLVLWRVQPARRRWPGAAVRRLGFMFAMAALLTACVLLLYGPLASLMRNHREARYLITPANYLYSLASVAAGDLRGQARPRQPIGEDAERGPGWAARRKPTLLVLVVGETARAANWGLNGYARDTTPRLARLLQRGELINFPDVTSCGSNTEVSLPCMFAPVGRRDYDEARIRGSQSLLHLLARAGVGVTWRDNQSGCKGVCDGLTVQTVASLAPPSLCQAGHCLDEGLLVGLPAMLRQMQGAQLLVLHPIGNHGPAYFRRYPAGFATFGPACGRDDLRRCSRAEIVNAYDNALRYTDHWLAQLIETLHAERERVDSAVVFVSDHGESLGENNLWLHGLPWAIAPDVQKRVPMVMWFSEGYARSFGLDLACLRRRAAASTMHDHLFHTLLGLLDVRTRLHEPAWDLGSTCRQNAAP